MIKIIAAMTPSRVIGNKGKLPWLPQDVPGELKWFQEATMGQVVVMGRTTWESLPAKFKPLSGRKNIVVSRTLDKNSIPEVTVLPTLDQVYSENSLDKDIWIIGGAQLYREALTKANELYLTILDKEFEGDTYFPEYKDVFVFSEDVRQGEGWVVKKFVRK